MSLFLIWFIANWIPLLYGLYDYNKETQSDGLDKD